MDHLVGVICLFDLFMETVFWTAVAGYFLLLECPKGITKALYFLVYFFFFCLCFMKAAPIPKVSCVLIKKITLKVLRVRQLWIYFVFDIMFHIFMLNWLLSMKYWR